VSDRQAFFNLHNDMAFNFDTKVLTGERKHKIGKFRKSILKFAEGNVLETGVGTSRNLQHYPLTCKVIGVDYSPKMIEVALQKNSLSNIDYEL
jgi:ubiquinone/menaquinone biosynthesis C-methylase UbiE